jgi:hypothetical protein
MRAQQPASPRISGWTNTILKVMKCIPHQYCSPDYLWNELAGSVVVTTYPQILCDTKWSLGGVLMSPNAMASFLLQLHKWSRSSSCSTSCRTISISGTYPSCVMDFYNLSSSAWISSMRGWSWSSTTNVCISLFTSIQVQPRLFFTPLYFLCCSMFALRSHLPAAA